MRLTLNMPNSFDASKVEAGEASEFARKLLIEFVRKIAEERGVSVAEIARRAGLHRSNVSRILSGRYSPELDTFLKIAGALDLHLDLREK